MPVAGRKPKPKGEAVTRHKQTFDWVEVNDVPFEGAPKLPLRCPTTNYAWSPATKRWWKSISTMPHCVLWRESDWEFAQFTAMLFEALVEVPTKSTAALLAREKVMGTTADFRRDLRIRYIDPNAERDLPAGVVGIDSFRDRLS